MIQLLPSTNPPSFSSQMAMVSSLKRCLCSSTGAQANILSFNKQIPIVTDPSPSTWDRADLPFSTRINHSHPLFYELLFCLSSYTLPHCLYCGEGSSLTDQLNSHSNTHTHHSPQPCKWHISLERAYTNKRIARNNHFFPWLISIKACSDSNRPLPFKSPWPWH